MKKLPILSLCLVTTSWQLQASTLDSLISSARVTSNVVVSPPVRIDISPLRLLKIEANPSAETLTVSIHEGGIPAGSPVHLYGHSTNLSPAYDVDTYSGTTSWTPNSQWFDGTDTPSIAGNIRNLRLVDQRSLWREAAPVKKYLTGYRYRHREGGREGSLTVYEASYRPYVPLSSSNQVLKETHVQYHVYGSLRTRHYINHSQAACGGVSGGRGTTYFYRCHNAPAGAMVTTDTWYHDTLTHNGTLLKTESQWAWEEGTISGLSITRTDLNQKSSSGVVYVAGLMPADVQSVGLKDGSGSFAWLTNPGDSLTISGQPVISFPDGFRVSTTPSQVQKVSGGVINTNNDYGLLAADSQPTSTTDPFWQLADQESSPPAWYSGSLPAKQSYVWRDGNAFKQILYSSVSPGFKTHSWLSKAPTHVIKVRLK